MRPLALFALALSCEQAEAIHDGDYSVHSPDWEGIASGDACGRVAIAEYEADQGECVRLEDTNGRALFKFESSENCGGPPCITAAEGEPVLVLEKTKPGLSADWTVQRGPCDELPACCGDYLGKWQCW